MAIDNIITVKETSELLGVTVKTVHNMIESELITVLVQLPGEKGSKLLDRAQVEQLARERRQTAK